MAFTGAWAHTATMDLNQITLSVTDFAAGVAFYQRLGLKLIVSARREYARFELPSGSTTLSLHLCDAVPANGPVLYLEVEDVDAAYRRLSAVGVAFDTEPTDEPWRWREARFRDPFGNRFCLYHAGLERRFPPWRLS